MIRVVVYDCGWGGDAFSERLEREMPVVEIQRVIDWRGGQFCEKSEVELRRMAEEALLGFIGKVDVIVLASYEMTVAALKYLRMRYPAQIFVGMSWPVLRGDTKRVVVLTTSLVRRSRSFRRFRFRMGMNMATQLCDGWMQAVDDGEMSEQKIKSDAMRTRRIRPQIVILGCTNLIDLREEIQRVYRGALVLDGYSATIKNLYRILNLRGASVELK